MYYGQPSGHAPFDVHGDFKGGDNYGKDGKQGMIVVGGADVDGKAYADGETGYGKGMYYGQPSGMMWPLGSIAAVGTNAAWDGVESVVRNETVGIIRTVEDIVEKNKTHSAGEIFDISFGQASLAAGGAFGGFKVNKGTNFKYVKKVGELAKKTARCICKREIESDTDPIMMNVPPSLSKLTFEDQTVDGFIQAVVSIFIILKLIFAKSSLASPYLSQICTAVGKRDVPLIECEEWIFDALDKYNNIDDDGYEGADEDYNGGDFSPQVPLVIDALSTLIFSYDNLVEENMT